MGSIDLKAMRLAAAGSKQLAGVAVRDMVSPHTAANDVASSGAKKSSADDDLDAFLADIEKTLLASPNTPAAASAERKPAVSASASIEAALAVASARAQRVANPDESESHGPLSVKASIELINKTHFVAPHAGEVSVWRETVDPEFRTRSPGPVSLNSFRLEYANVLVDVVGGGGAAVSKSAAALWLAHKDRRQYPGGVVLQPEGATPPGTFNLWQGFGVSPQAGDAAPMLEHFEMLCGAQAGYVLDWMALCVQKPGGRPEVALVLRGGQGTGKGTAVRVMLDIFGHHGLHITQPRHLVGNFNSHLRSALFLFVDEGHWPGDKSAEGVLKGLITEPTIAIEMKGQDVFTAPNRLKMVMASNNDWVIPANADERRYCVVDVPRTRANDHAYFASLNAWVGKGGAGIFLHHLLNRDLSRFNVRAVPQTAALDRQKIEAMHPLDRWLLDALDAGTGLDGAEWADGASDVACAAVATSFELYCRRAGARGRQPDTRGIGKRLQTVFSCGAAAVRRSGTRGEARVRVWNLPGLAVARTAAATAFGLSHYEWGQS